MKHSCPPYALLRVFHAPPGARHMAQNQQLLLILILQIRNKISFNNYYLFRNSLNKKRSPSNHFWSEMVPWNRETRFISPTVPLRQHCKGPRPLLLLLRWLPQPSRLPSVTLEGWRPPISQRFLVATPHRDADQPETATMTSTPRETCRSVPEPPGLETARAFLSMRHKMSTLLCGRERCVLARHPEAAEKYFRSLQCPAMLVSSVAPLARFSPVRTRSSWGFSVLPG